MTTHSPSGISINDGSEDEYMEKAFPAPTPLAVRLARIAHPRRAWSPGEPPGTAWGEVASPDLESPEWFDLNSLDSLALAERRVCEAGFGLNYAHELKRVIGPVPGLDGQLRLITAPADQRWRALIAVLDANPELERRLTAK